MKADQLDQEWYQLKNRLLNAQFISQVESVLDMMQVKTYDHGKIQYNEFQIPQKMVSLTTDPRFRVEQYLFTALFQWTFKDKSMKSKKIILFSNHHNTAAVYDLFDN